MKIKFKVHHMYGLAHEEIFTAEDLGIKNISPDDWSKDSKYLSNSIKPLLMKWTEEHYNHGDALPSWEVVHD